MFASDWPYWKIQSNFSKKSSLAKSTARFEIPPLAKRANVIQGLSMSILRMPAVKAETGHRSHASIYNAIKAGLFTTGVAIGQRSKGWPSDEVQAINAARIAGKSEAEIKELVNRLHAKRLELATA